MSRPPTRRRLDRAASLTAQFNAAQRAAEYMQPVARRLLDDPYSRHFAGRYTPLLITPLVARAALLVIDRYLAGLHAHIVLRARYADDVLHDAIANGITQLVLLGAGFDTTAFRAAPTQTLTIFEVDAPATQSEKCRVINRVGLSVDNRIHWVACDFEQDRLLDCLRQAEFDPLRPSLVIWLGVSFYLSPAAFAHTLSELAALSAPSSLLVLDYGDPQLVTEDHTLAAARRATRAVRRRGEPYRSGFTQQQITAVLSAHGYTVRHHARVPDLMKRYSPMQGSYATDDWLGIATAERQPKHR
ncbi:SAM-dependent methyltransferase [Mycobacterium sp.]|uniref:class I SAM-dependent methyltransferase n=1 Tax=Mycobacterium sp. TaxID=1785 RepID=UPI0031DAD7F5